MSVENSCLVGQLYGSCKQRHLYLKMLQQPELRIHTSVGLSTHTSVGSLNAEL